VRTLDSYNLRNVSLLSVDVETAEQAVFYGARQTIRREMPVIFFARMCRKSPNEARERDIITTEISRTRFVLFDVQNRKIGPYLTTTKRILIPGMILHAMLSRGGICLSGRQ
jgi:hypothetical protein